jgi:hypothetical protein
MGRIGKWVVRAVVRELHNDTNAWLLRHSQAIETLMSPNERRSLLRTVPSYTRRVADGRDEVTKALITKFGLTSFY